MNTETNGENRGLPREHPSKRAILGRAAVLLMAVAILALMLDYAGPLAGWIDQVFGTSEQSVDRPAQHGAPPPPMAAYELPPEPTPASMRPTVLAVSEWLEMQHRRVGGKIADELSGNRQGHLAVLYLTVNPAFRQQDRRLQLQIAEGIWRYWAERATGADLAGRLGDAHLVLLNANGEIIGGSRFASASKQWIRN